jgi:hypothetical protein
MRLADILTLHYLDSQQALHEEVKKTLADNSVGRLFDSRRNTRVSEIVAEHSLEVVSISNILDTENAVGAVRNLKEYMESGNTQGFSTEGIEAIQHPELAGRDCTAIPLKNVMLTRLESVASVLNSKNRTVWEVSGATLTSDGDALYLDPRYGWYHIETGSSASVVENRILPLVKDVWDSLTKNDWQTVFEGSVKPATKVKRARGYGFEIRTKNESTNRQAIPASRPRQSGSEAGKSFTH